MARIHVKRMPQRMLPRTFLTIRTAVKMMPIMARRTVMPTVWKVPVAADCLTENRASLVAGLATMICAFSKPMRAMNRPMPAETAFFKVMGMALKMASRTLVKDRMIKIRPSKKTAAKAISQV